MSGQALERASESTIYPYPAKEHATATADILKFPQKGSQEDANARVLAHEVKTREERLTAAIEQYADVLQVLVNRMCGVLEMQETRLRDGLKTGTSRAFHYDEKELARVRKELEAVRAISKAMKG